MKTPVALFTVAVTLTLALVPTDAKAGPLVSRPGVQEKPCMVDGDANACFLLGYRFMKEKKRNSHLLAKFYFQKGCELQKGSACSKDESKVAVRQYSADTTRAIASQPKNQPVVRAQRARK